MALRRAALPAAVGKAVGAAVVVAVLAAGCTADDAARAHDTGPGSGTGSAAVAAGPDPVASGAADQDAPANDDDASRFVACLATHDVEARIAEEGFVLVRYAPFDGGRRPTGPAELDRFERHLVHATADERQRGWVVPLRGAFFAATDPLTAQAWDECQVEHPGFQQLTWDDVAAFDAGAAAQAAQAAIDFAARARRAGFAWVPDPEQGDTIELPAWITEAELRDLLAEALDPSGPWISFTAPDATGFAWRDVVAEFDGAGLG